MKRSKVNAKEFLEFLLKEAEYYREVLVNDVKDHPEKVWDIIDIAKMTLPKRKLEDWRRRHWSILEPAILSQITPVDGWVLNVAPTGEPSKAVQKRFLGVWPKWNQ